MAAASPRTIAARSERVPSQNRRSPYSPSRIKRRIAVDLPRPRPIEVTTSPEFHALEREVLALIREESVRAAADTAVGRSAARGSRPAGDPGGILLANILAKVSRVPETWNVHKAKTHLSALIDLALRGEEVVISRANRPVVRLVALQPAARRRTPGLHASSGFWMSPDFDEPFPESFWFGKRSPGRARRAQARRRNGSK